MAEIFLFPLGGGKKEKSTSRSDFFPTVNFSTNTALAAPFPPSLFTQHWYLSAIALCGQAGWNGEIYTERARSRWYLWWWLVCKLFANFILRHNAAPRMCSRVTWHECVCNWRGVKREKSRSSVLSSALSLFLATWLALCGVFPECSRIIRMKWQNAAVDEIPSERCVEKNALQRLLKWGSRFYSLTSSFFTLLNFFCCCWFYSLTILQSSHFSAFMCSTVIATHHASAEVESHFLHAICMGHEDIEMKNGKTRRSIIWAFVKKLTLNYSRSSPFQLYPIFYTLVIYFLAPLKK